LRMALSQALRERVDALVTALRVAGVEECEPPARVRTALDGKLRSTPSQAAAEAFVRHLTVVATAAAAAGPEFVATQVVSALPEATPGGVAAADASVGDWLASAANIVGRALVAALPAVCNRGIAFLEEGEYQWAGLAGDFHSQLQASTLAAAAELGAQVCQGTVAELRARRTVVQRVMMLLLHPDTQQSFMSSTLRTMSQALLAAATSAASEHAGVPELMAGWCGDLPADDVLRLWLEAVVLSDDTQCRHLARLLSRLNKLSGDLSFIALRGGTAPPNAPLAYDVERARVRQCLSFRSNSHLTAPLTWSKQTFTHMAAGGVTLAGRCADGTFTTSHLLAPDVDSGAAFALQDDAQPSVGEALGLLLAPADPRAPQPFARMMQGKATARHDGWHQHVCATRLCAEPTLQATATLSVHGFVPGWREPVELTTVTLQVRATAAA
jgi:hypothetical protein